MEFNLSEVDYHLKLDRFREVLPGFVFVYFEQIKKSLNSETDIENSNHVLKLCETLIDFSWEMLNTNLWVFVDEYWRFVYAYATLYKILIIQRYSNVSSNAYILEEEITKLCDLGLLLSGDILSPYFNKLVKSSKSSCQTAQPNKFKSIELSENERLSEEISTEKRSRFNLMYEISPSVLKFKSKYFEAKIPVIIDKQMNHWPAMTKWSVDYLISIAGKRTVPVEIGSKYTDDNWRQNLMTIEAFIKQYILLENNDDVIENKGYLAQHPLFNQIPELRDDIYIPEYCYFMSSDDDVDKSTDINAWFGPKGTISPLHYDPKHNFLCQVIGKKYVRLYDEKYSASLYAYDGQILKNTSQLDPENIDVSKFPSANAVPYWEGIISEGQMLYIPAKCWHYVKSLSLSFSVSFWWD